MNTSIRLLSACAIQASAFAVMSVAGIAQEVPPVPQQKVMQKICAFDPVENLLPSPSSQQTSSPLSYLQEQGFTQNPDGSWVCYISVPDPNKQWRYYTLFKVQEINGKLIASSFLDKGTLINGQDNRSLNFFMLLIEHHTNTKEGNRESIRRYLETFISYVKQGKVSLSRRGYLFDLPSHGLVLYHPTTDTKLQGTAITININMTSKESSVVK